MPSGEPPCDALEGASKSVYLCEDVTQGIIFVREDGDDDAEGSREQPVKTLQRALTKASGREDIFAILIAGSPEIKGPIVLNKAIDLIGGFDMTFAPDSNARPTIVANKGPVVRIMELEDAMALHHLDVTLSQTPEDAPSWGIHVEKSPSLVLQEVKVILPAGKDGVDGTAGTDGERGQMGFPGGDGTRIAPGQPGLNMACPQADGGTGGRGGDQGTAASQGQMSASGTQGGALGQNGQNGAPTTAAMPGEQATAWTITAGMWSPGRAAMAGEKGQDGQGGGGGGGGAASGGQGGGGGGGGAGGCGGQGGQPGSSGHATLGVTLQDATLELRQSSLLLGDGGRSGLGGKGGQGAQGMMGGQGSLGASGGAQGGAGGQGSRGADGGRGGDGLAGESITVMCLGQSTLIQDTMSILSPGQGGLWRDGTRAPSAPSIDCQSP